MRNMLLRWLLGIFFIVAGVGHFWKPAAYLAIMPPYIPWPLAMVYVSGVAEIAGGLGVLIPQTTRAAAWGLMLLLVAVFPANLHMALHPELFPQFPAWTLWARLPFQALFLLWAWRFARA